MLLASALLVIRGQQEAKVSRALPELLVTRARLVLPELLVLVLQVLPEIGARLVLLATPAIRVT